MSDPATDDFLNILADAAELIDMQDRNNRIAVSVWLLQRFGNNVEFVNPTYYVPEESLLPIAKTVCVRLLLQGRNVQYLRVMFVLSGSSKMLEFISLGQNINPGNPGISWFYQPVDHLGAAQVYIHRHHVYNKSLEHESCKLEIRIMHGDQILNSREIKIIPKGHKFPTGYNIARKARELGDGPVITYEFNYNGR